MRGRAVMVALCSRSALWCFVLFTTLACANVLSHQSSLFCRREKVSAEMTEKPIAYKPTEAARPMGISERKLDGVDLATKQIRCSKIGKSRRITLEAINAFIKRAELAAK